MILTLLAILTLAFLNRCRGDDTWMPSWVRGRPLYYVSPVVGLIALAFNRWEVAAAFAAGYFLWGTDAWGRWFDLGRLPDPGPERPPSLTERWIEAISFGHDHVALAWRHFGGILPFSVFMALLQGSLFPLYLAPVFAIAVVGAYEMAWRFRPASPIICAEYTVGCFWGIMITAY